MFNMEPYETETCVPTELADSFFCLLQQTQMDCCHNALVKKNRCTCIVKNSWNERKKKCGTGKKKRPLEDTQGQILLRGLIRYMYIFCVALLERRLFTQKTSTP